MIAMLAICFSSYADAQMVTRPANGGTGVRRPTAHRVIIAEGVSAFNVLDSGKSGYALVSKAGQSDPSWQALNSVVRLTADTTTTSQTLVGTPLQFSATDTQSYYWFDATIIDTSSTSAGIKLGVSLPSGGTIVGEANGMTTGVTATLWDYISASATAGGVFTSVASIKGMIHVHGVVHIGSAAGSVMLEFLKVTGGTGALLAGSSITWGKI